MSKNIRSPAWHADILQARSRHIREGKSRFHTWSAAKQRIRERAGRICQRVKC
jgi:hypothetical protein